MVVVRTSPGNPNLARIVTHTPGFATAEELREILSPVFREQAKQVLNEIDTAGTMERASERMMKLAERCPQTRRSE